MAAALLLILSLTHPALAQTTDGTWSPIPPPQSGPRMFACDSLRNQLLFQTAPGTIWSLSLSGPPFWAVLDPLAPAGEPFYDPIRDRVIVIGRASDSTLVAARSLAGGTWDSLWVAGVPPPPGARRNPGLMVYDAARDRVVMFGTTDIFNTVPVIRPSNETWVLPLGSAQQWTQLSPAGAPPRARRFESAIFDPVRAKLVLFGGVGSNIAGFDSLLIDTWELTLGSTLAWNNLPVEGVLPPGRRSAATVYDPVGDQMLMFEGTGLSGSIEDGSFWSLPLSAPRAWSTLSVDLLDLQGTHRPSMVANPRERRVVISGVTNENGSSQSPTSGWTLTYYPQFNPPAYLIARQNWPEQPALWARAAAAGVYDAVADRLLIYGGGGFGDTWSLSLASQQWSPLDPLPVPIVPPINQHESANIVLDSARNRLLRFDTVPGFQCQTFEMDLGNALGWSQVSTTGVTPFGRDFPSIVRDPVNDRILMFGGSSSQLGYTNQLWELTLGGTPRWTLLAPSGPPPTGRNQAAAVYDSVGRRLVVYGGTISGAPAMATDTWACNFAGAPAWQPLSPSGEPPLPVFGGQANAVGIYDPRRARMVVVAPESLRARQGAWAMSLGPSPAWTHLALSGPPPEARYAVTAVYDPRRDAALMFSGTGSFQHNDTWFLDFTPAASPSVTCPGDLVWVPGANTGFQIGIVSSLDQTADYQLTSERPWPGYPITGTVPLQANTPLQLPLSAPVPDTVSAGLNVLAFTLTPRGSTASASCSFHIHDASTPTLTVQVLAIADPDQVSLNWYAPDPNSRYTLERGTLSDGWQGIASVISDSRGHCAYVDKQITAGQRYGYRISTVSGGVARVSAETWVAVPSKARLALLGLQPNPGGGRLSVAFTLPDAAPVRLELVDVSGRRIRERSLSGLTPGVHVVDLDVAGTVHAGIYFVRLTHGREVVTARGIVVR